MAKEYHRVGVLHCIGCKQYRGVTLYSLGGTLRICKKCKDKLQAGETVATPDGKYEFALNERGQITAKEIKAEEGTTDGKQAK